MTLRVLALTRYDRIGASSRVRFYQFVPYLSSAGIELVVSPLLGSTYIQKRYSRQNVGFLYLLVSYVKRFFVLLHSRNYDFLWIEKELFPDVPGFVEKLLSFFNVKYVVDYDDAIFHNYDLNQRLWRRLMANKIDQIMLDAALVVCGNSYLGKRAESAGARSIIVLPTVIDLDRYSVLRRRRSGPIVIGWIGSSATVKYLIDIFPALKALSEVLPFKLRVLGAQISEPGLHIDCLPWSESDEVKQIQGFDIGIMPLKDSPWEKGKCGYKLIQYMACGLPVVASPVGVNQEIVANGVNGYLASNSDDWFGALYGLATNQALCNQFGDSGRVLVETRYCLQVIAPVLSDLFINLSDRSRD